MNDTPKSPSVLSRFRLDSKVAVVTGASKNVGLAISQAFAEAGASVFMVARGDDALEAGARAVRETTGAEVRTVVADVGTVDGTERILDAVHDRFGQADVLVNNAMSTAHRETSFDASDDGWQESLNVNLLGPYRLCRGFGRRMLEGHGGSVINVLSGAGFVPVRGYVQYGSAKAALWMMTKYMSTEYSKSVRFNALVPGTTVEPQNVEAWTTSTWEHQYKDLVPMGRVGHPAEIAPAALYLASDASSYTTGALLTVNGGRPQ